MSYSPLTGLAYVNTINQGAEYRASMSVDELQKLQPGESHRGLNLKPIYDDPDHRGFLKAIDPLTGKSKWEIGFKSPNWSGTLVTAGGLVFTLPAEISPIAYCDRRSPGKENGNVA